MKKRIYEYFKTRKNFSEARNTLTLLALNKYNELLAVQAEKEQAERDACIAVKRMNESFSPEDLKQLIQTVSEFTSEIQVSKNSKSQKE